MAQTSDIDDDDTIGSISDFNSQQQSISTEDAFIYGTKDTTLEERFADILSLHQYTKINGFC